MTPSELTLTTNSVADKEDNREIITDECMIQVCQIQLTITTCLGNDLETFYLKEIMYSLYSLDIIDVFIFKSVLLVILVLHLKLQKN